MSEQSNKPYLKKFLLAFFITFIICGTLIAAIFIGALTGFFGGVNDLDLPALTDNASSQIFYIDDSGEEAHLLTLTSAQNKVWVDSADIPQAMKDAFVAIEDERFYEHSGFDWARTVKAFFTYLGNQFTGKATTFGGSTITQQLVKNLTGDSDQTPARKIREISQAVNLEKQISKDKILELYMNSIYLSQGCYGVQAASHEFFGKPVNELSLAQCAAIAGITQYPSYYDPIINPENNREKQKIVLKKMFELEMISRDELRDALAEEMVFGAQDSSDEQFADINSYFIDQVIYDLMDELETRGYSKVLAGKVVYSGGLRIVTTIDRKVQNAIEEVYENPSKFPNATGDNPVQSAMIVIDPKNGEVKGLVGGIGQKTDNLVLNRASQSLRQPGSTIKPIAVYAPALEAGVITAASTFVDKSQSYNGWIPHNYSRTFSNIPVTVREALKQSLNTTPVSVLEEFGAENSFSFLTEKLGITSLVEEETNSNGKVFSDIGYASLALGGLTHGISPLELTAAYTPFANGGLYSKPHFIKSVTDSHGKTIIRNDPEYTNAMSEETAYIMSRMLNEVVTSGTGRGAALSSGMYTAGKTGTTSDNNDRWFVGYTPHYVATVWYGYDTPKPISASGNPCIPVWREVMNKIHEDKEVIVEITKPTDIVTASYCVYSGRLGTQNCPVKKSFYFSTSNLPKGYCGATHAVEPTDEEKEDENAENPEGTDTPDESAPVPDGTAAAPAVPNQATAPEPVPQPSASAPAPAAETATM